MSGISPLRVEGDQGKCIEIVPLKYESMNFWEI